MSSVHVGMTDRDVTLGPDLNLKENTTSFFALYVIEYIKESWWFNMNGLESYSLPEMLQTEGDSFTYVLGSSSIWTWRILNIEYLLLFSSVRSSGKNQKKYSKFKIQNLTRPKWWGSITGKDCVTL